MANVRVDDYERNLANELLTEWERWVDSKTPVEDEPNWTLWSGKATVILALVAERQIEYARSQKGDGERGNVPGKQDS